MDKKKIETFGEFCTLVANEPENIEYYDNLFKTSSLMGNVRLPIGDSDLWKRVVERYWNDGSTYYHITQPKKKKIMAQYYNTNTGDMYVKCVDSPHIAPNTKIPNTEFEVNEDGTPVED